ncbi:FecR family protein [Altericroceibacterium endophyticum]|uniref:DUF4880 domain-containing protein n=1 Tax=Altericroceibacterium endophyticum TaxID=1808508 RepID=A0A6I4T8G5_9SPHN|nr:FecR domain-containing protein [Altericroceibacterium endophyticum]MXO66411.1 DUF4880 domain-containing protein [Altericroceibacterium endophyticum]
MNDDVRPSGKMDEAATWYARLNAPDCSAEDRQRLSEWRKANTRNEAAWQGILAADRRMDAVASHPMIADMIRDARSLPPVSADASGQERGGEASFTSSRRSFAGWQYGIAAALTLAVGLGGLAVWNRMNSPARDAVQIADVTSYTTTIGETRLVTLADGSRITLDTDSAIEVPQWKDRRIVHLTKGRAFFEVAKDAAHPFVVESDGKSVEALGTSFTVRDEGKAYSVALLEGRVKVDLGMAGARSTILAPGDTLSLMGKTVAVRHQDADRLSGWLNGRLTFEQQPLGTIVAEMNRYSARHIVLADPELETQKFSGTFTLDGSDALIRALDAYGIARVLRRSSTEVVLGAQ